VSEETSTADARARRAALRERRRREAGVAIPLPADAPPPFDPAAYLQERAAAEGRELPLSKPLSRRGERVFIVVVAAVFVAGTVLAFTMERPSSTGVGWFLGVFGCAVLAALVWAHLGGGFDRKGSVPRPRRAARPPAARRATATVAPAPEASVAPTTHRLASIRARLAAGLLDQALALLPLLLAGLANDRRLLSHAAITGLLLLALALFLLGAPLWLWLTNGRTPGRRLLGIRVVRTDGRRLTLRGALRRELGGLGRAGLLMGLMSVASMDRDELRRSEADTRAGTVVVVDDDRDADRPR
jgi:uncharacterized RDD family membrane protein YckC